MYKVIAFILLGILGLVDAKWLSEIPNAPNRYLSKLFAIPTWISDIEGIQRNETND
jgi:hypothetical protein